MSSSNVNACANDALTDHGPVVCTDQINIGEAGVLVVNQNHPFPFLFTAVFPKLEDNDGWESAESFIQYREKLERDVEAYGEINSIVPYVKGYPLVYGPEDLDDSPRVIEYGGNLFRLFVTIVGDGDNVVLAYVPYTTEMEFAENTVREAQLYPIQSYKRKEQAWLGDKSPSYKLH